VVDVKKRKKKCYDIIFSQQIIRSRLLLVNKKVILVIDSNYNQ